VNAHPREPQDHYEPAPRPLPPAADVVAAEDVHQDGDHDPDPDHPGEEDDHRPQDVQERVVGRYHHVVALLGIAAGTGDPTQPAHQNEPCGPRSRATSPGISLRFRSLSGATPAPTSRPPPPPAAGWRFPWRSWT